MSELLRAVYRGDRERVKALLASEPRLDVFEAAAVGHTERVRELVDGAPELVAALAQDGFTALHLAAFFHHPKTAPLLVERGAPVDTVALNELSVQPLHSAVAAGEQETAALLLARGADANARQQAGFTPLHGAAQHGDAGLVELLLRHGADPALAADDGRTAADFARDGGHRDLAARLAPYDRSPGSAVTSASAKPSSPLLPTVWIAVALTRVSAASSSLKRRMPSTRGSSRPSSDHGAISHDVVGDDHVPRRVSSSARASYSGFADLSASRKTTSKGPPPSAARRASGSSASPTRTSTRAASPAGAMFARATSAYRRSASRVIRRPSAGSARASQIAL